MESLDARHVIVVGAMGVGKTTIGRLLAARLGLRFLDSDQVIEATTGGPGSDIADTDGVEQLHALELGVFLDLCSSDERSVIAPAASVVDHETGREALVANITVWLTAPDHIVAQRQRSGTHRRAIDAETRTALRVRRTPLLEAVSTITLDAGSATPEDLVSELVARLEAVSPPDGSPGPSENPAG